MPSLQNAFTWAEDKCEEPNVGYSQTYRRGEVVDGIQYYDCSSFIYAALVAGGFDFAPDYQWFWTGNQTQAMKSVGWTEYVFQDGVISDFALRNGDVLIRGAGRSDVPGDVSTDEGHTEMVWDAARGYTMGAHSSSLELSDQVSKHYIDQRKERWFFVMRYGEGAVPGSPSFTAAGLPYRNNSGLRWVYKSDYDMTDADEENNAKIVYWYLWNMGWSRIAITAWLANINYEAHFQPRAEQTPGSPDDSLVSGFGLVQWTPRSKIKLEARLIDGVDTYYNSGDLQMNAILAEYAYCNWWYNKNAGKAYPVKDSGNKFSFDTIDNGALVGWLPVHNGGADWGWTDVPNGLSWYDAVHDTGKWTLEQHVKIWLSYYGRGDYTAVPASLPTRLQYADRWWKFFENYLPDTPGEPTIKKRRGMPAWMMAYPF